MKRLLLFSTSMIIAAVATGSHAASPLETALVSAVRDAHFETVLDSGPGGQLRPARPTAHPSNVNVAVIQFDAAGRMVDRAYVLLSRDYPQGLIVHLDENLGASHVHFLRWDSARFDGGTFDDKTGKRLTEKGWTNNPELTAADDLVPASGPAVAQFMVPYPASLFKSMVAFHLMRMIDAGKTSLDAKYTYAPPGARPETRSLRAWIDAMITHSDNHATAALLKMFHDRGEIEPLNQEFQRLNLPTLSINGTDPQTGLRWSTSQVTLTAWDIARMFWIIDGGPGDYWRDTHGQPVNASLLSQESRLYLKKILSEQGFNDCLSTANYGATPQVSPGIPSRVDERWINRTNGHVLIIGRDYGADIRPANARAEVNFAHKTGFTLSFGSDAGIVTSLPGKPFRHYIIAFVANLGSRYVDDHHTDGKVTPPIYYTQKIPALGKAIDDAIIRLSANLPAVEK